MQFQIVLASIALVVVSGCVSSTGQGPCPPCGKQSDISTVASGKPAGRVISLGDSLAPLQHRFNADKNKVRLVALLSPT